jgi:hypothetical protein
MLQVQSLAGFGAGPAAGGAPATVSQEGQSFTNASQTVFTESGMAIGTAAADRTVIVIACGGANTRTVSSLTIGGNSASLVKRQQDGIRTTEIWAYALTTGTTADIVTTWSGSQLYNAAWTFAAYGIGAAHDTDGAGQPSPMSITIDCPAGGIIIGGVCNSSNRTNTWAGVTEDGDVANDNLYNSAGSDAFASIQTGLTVSATLSASAATSPMAVASWGPAG